MLLSTDIDRGLPYLTVTMNVNIFLRFLEKSVHLSLSNRQVLFLDNHSFSRLKLKVQEANSNDCSAAVVFTHHESLLYVL